MTKDKIELTQMLTGKILEDIRPYSEKKLLNPNEILHALVLCMMGLVMSVSESKSEFELHMASLTARIGELTHDPSTWEQEDDHSAMA